MSHVMAMAPARGFSTKSANGGVRDGGLSEFAAHEDHLTGWDNGAVAPGTT